MGVGLIGVQRHGQPQVRGRGELHQGQGREPTMKVQGFMYNQAARKIGESVSPLHAHADCGIASIMPGVDTLPDDF